MEPVQAGHPGGRLKKLIIFLLYTLEQGPVEKEIIKQALARGLPIPSKIRDAPDFPLGLELYFLGWQDLSSSRTMGLGPGMIPWVAIHEYCLVHEIVEGQREDMFYHIGKLDEAYLAHVSK